MSLTTPRWVQVVLIAACVTANAYSQERPKGGERNVNMKSRVGFNGCTWHIEGVVEKVDGTSVTIFAKWNGRDNEEPKSYTFEPVDVLATGGLKKFTSGKDAYLWSDLKKDDTVQLGIVGDEGDNKWYCVDISIERRPGAKLPKSQEPEEDSRYAKHTIYNDLDNGLDVRDEEISTAFTRAVHPSGWVVREGGLPADYQKKLDAIRAKKAKEKDADPKAKPPLPPAEKK